MSDNQVVVLETLIDPSLGDSLLAERAVEVVLQVKPAWRQKDVTVKVRQ